MGSCMMIAVAREPKFDAAAVDWCDANQIDAEGREELLIRVLEHRATVLEIAEDLTWYGDANEVTDADGAEIAVDAPGWAEALTRQIRAALARGIRMVLEDDSEVTSLRMPDGDWLATGGPSWGDTPTDAYESMILIDAYGITNAPIDAAEVAATHARAAAA